MYPPNRRKFNPALKAGVTYPYPMPPHAAVCSTAKFDGIARPAAHSLDPFPSDLDGRIGRSQYQTVADELIVAHEIALVAGPDAIVAMMRHDASLLVDRVGAKISDVILQGDEGLLRP